MNPQLRKFSTPRRAGLTLIEVIAATVLLATLLVAALTAFGQHREQLRRGLAKHKAVAAMDQLMADWFAAKDWNTLPTSGVCNANTDLFWTVRRLPAETLGDNWPVVRLRFEIFALNERSTALLGVELLAADERLSDTLIHPPVELAQ